MSKGKRGAPAPRPRSGFVTEEQRNTVRTRVPKTLAVTLAARWGVSTTDAVIRAVREATMNMFAAVGDDGFRPVVWGLGATEAEAVDDAEENLAQANAGSKLEVHRISEEQAAIVRAGDVSWPVPQSGGDE